MIIGVTGPSGAGKTVVAKLFGYKIIDADKLYREILEENEELQRELTKEFGTCKRNELKNIVFDDTKSLSKLNSITFKYTVTAIKKEIKKYRDVVVDVPLLFESGLNSECDITVAVLAEKEVRIRRIIERDGLTKEQAEKRIDAQKSDEFYIKSANYTVNNNGDDVYKLVKNLKTKIIPKIAIFGGSFDPVTVGHLDVIRRAADIYDKLYVVVLVNPDKTPAFTADERVEMLKTVTADITNVQVDFSLGLLAKYACDVGASYSVKGLRDGIDMNSEREQFEANAKIARLEFGFALDTVFIPTSLENYDTRSSTIKEFLKGGAYKAAKVYLDGRIADSVITTFQNKNRHQG